MEYRMHPGIAHAICVSTSPSIRDATDMELAAFWRQISVVAREQEGGEAGQAIVRAGLAAAPYLLRLEDWDTADYLLHGTLSRALSPAAIQAALPNLRAIANATQAPRYLINLANALKVVDPAEAEKLLRGALARAVVEQDFRLASTVARSLTDYLSTTGRLREALDLAEQGAGFTQQAGLGPWSQLSDQSDRLIILALMGEHQQVLEEVRMLLAQMDKLPTTQDDNELAIPWSVREAILNVGGRSAKALGLWQQLLDFTDATLVSLRARNAGEYALAYITFNDYLSLKMLGRLDEADQLLVNCQQVFEDHNDLDQLGNVASARADLENTRGNPASAVVLQQASIRYHYLRPDARDIAVSHRNLANYLWQTGSDPVPQRAHRLAYALICRLTGMSDILADAVNLLASEIQQDTGQHLPGSLDEVIAVAEQTEGVHLGQLLASLQPDTQAAEDALAQILRTAAQMDPYQNDIQQHLQEWEPVIAATVAAAAGNAEAAAELGPVLDGYAQQNDWAALVAVLRRILDGEHADGLLDGLDPIDTAIASQVLARLTQPPAAPRQEGP